MYKHKKIVFMFALIWAISMRKCAWDVLGVLRNKQNYSTEIVKTSKLGQEI